MASIGSIVGGGFKLVAERPVAVAVWTAINLAVSVGTQLLMMAMFDPAASDPNTAMLAMWGALTPLYLLSILLYVVMLCAAYRAVLRPEEGGLAFMKLGGDELRVLLMIILLFIGGFIGYLLLMLAVMLITMLLAFAGGSIGALVAIPLYIAALCVVIYAWVRLSLVTPMTFLRHRLVFDEAWTVTRGNFWTLFLAYLVILIVTLVLSGIAYYPILAPMIAAISQLSTDPQAMESAQMAQFEQQMNQPLPMLLLWGALVAVVQTVIMAIGAGATATATRELMADAGSLSEEDVDRTAEIFE
jgi:hypothetical protein